MALIAGGVMPWMVPWYRSYLKTWASSSVILSFTDFSQRNRQDMPSVWRERRDNCMQMLNLCHLMSCSTSLRTKGSHCFRRHWTMWDRFHRLKQQERQDSTEQLHTHLDHHGSFRIVSQGMALSSCQSMASNQTMWRSPSMQVVSVHQMWRSFPKLG